MNKAEIINNIKQYFSVKELVSKAVFDKWGERSWQFLDEKMLETLLVIRRDILQVGLVCNDWSFGGKNQQRGLRENICQIVSQKTRNGQTYISPHILGKAFDLVSAKMSAEEMRRQIVNKAYLLPYPIRIERDVSWLHIDVMTQLDQTYKIYSFSA